MNLVDDYIAHANEAEARAAQATGDYRAQMLVVAEQWRVLARQARFLAELEQRITREKPAQSTS